VELLSALNAPQGSECGEMDKGGGGPRRGEVFKVESVRGPADFLWWTTGHRKNDEGLVGEGGNRSTWGKEKL